jgi:hypothetical protein
MSMKPRAAIGSVAMAVGAAVGTVLVAPIGLITVDGSPDCRSCPTGSTTILIGLHISGEYPGWLPFLAAVAGAAIVLGILGSIWWWHRLPTRRA